MKYKNIVWDWNGTLLNDVEAGVNTLNDMLDRRGMQVLTAQEYKDCFGFPVVDFYREVGFDFNRVSMHELSIDFVDTYAVYAGELDLNPQVTEVLEEVQQAGVKQYVLSALREDLLQGMILSFDIAQRFTQVCGSDNIYANEKVERGERMVEAYGIRPEETLMIGDTLHDAEVAEALGFHCVLYAGGHNSEWRLRERGTVIQNMRELLKYAL